jgi:hypothetical protein
MTMAHLVERVGAFLGHEFLVDLPSKNTISSGLRVPSVNLRVLLTLAASSALKYLLIEAIVIGRDQY